MATATTNTASAGASAIVTFPPKGLIIKGNVSALQYCNAGQDQFHRLAGYFDAEAVALRADIIEMLRSFGLDGNTTIGPLSFGSDAAGAARKAVKPLFAMSADAENIAKALGVLKRNLDALVWDPIQRIEDERARRSRGAGLKLGS